MRCKLEYGIYFTIRFCVAIPATKRTTRAPNFGTIRGDGDRLIENIRQAKWIWYAPVQIVSVDGQSF